MLKWAEDVNDACLERWPNAGGHIRTACACHGAQPVPGHTASGGDVVCGYVDAEPVR